MKKLIVLAAVVLFIVGCGGGKNYWPLTVGNIWNYTTTTTMTHSDTLVNDTTFTSTYKNEITAEVTLTNGDPAFEQVNTYGTFVDTSYVAEVEDFVLGYDSLSDTDPDTMLVNPLEEGASWTVTSDSAWTLKIYVIAKEDSSLTVPAGTYDDVWKAYQVMTMGTTAETTTVYLAPDVGFVKSAYQDVMVILNDTITTDVSTELTNVTIQ